MKTLRLIRHAKSSWRDLSLDDKQRPLKSRGKQDAALMASKLNGLSFDLTRVFCSTAVRASQTAELLFANIVTHTNSVSYDPKLYTFDMRVLLRWLLQQDESCHDITIIGHNPALLELTNYLTAQHIEHLPTCAYVELSVEDKPWSSVTQHCALRTQFISPKMLK